MVDYPLFGKVQKEIERAGLAIDEVTYLEKVAVKVWVPADGVAAFKARMIDFTAAQAGVDDEGPLDYRPEP